MSILATQSQKAIRYNHSHLMKNLESFSRQHKVSSMMFPYLFLFAAEDYFTSVYYPSRYGRELRNHRILANPEDLAVTPAMCIIRKGSINGQSNKCGFDFVFPLGHTNLETIRYGYAQQVVSAYSEHALMQKPIEEHNPLKPAFVKHVSTGSIASAEVSIMQVTEILMPSLAHNILPLFKNQKNDLMICNNESICPQRAQCKNKKF